MDAIAVMQVSSAVVGLTYLLQWSGVSHRWAPLLVPLLSALGIAIWAYAQGTISQADTFRYVVAWISVATSSATVWGFTYSTRRTVGRTILVRTSECVMRHVRDAKPRASSR